MRWGFVLYRIPCLSALGCRICTAKPQKSYAASCRKKQPFHPSRSREPDLIWQSRARIPIVLHCMCHKSTLRPYTSNVGDVGRAWAFVSRYSSCWSITSFLPFIPSLPRSFFLLQVSIAFPITKWKSRVLLTTSSLERQTLQNESSA